VGELRHGMHINVTSSHQAFAELCPSCLTFPQLLLQLVICQICRHAAVMSHRCGAVFRARAETLVRRRRRSKPNSQLDLWKGKGISTACTTLHACCRAVPYKQYQVGNGRCRHGGSKCTLFALPHMRDSGLSLKHNTNFTRSCGFSHLAELRSCKPPSLAVLRKLYPTSVALT
jgi:hypothetical protein